jgi:hypothetical protein
MKKELLEYILLRLPIFNENPNSLSLENIAREFGLYDKYDPELTQEEIVDFLLENI